MAGVLVVTDIFGCSKGLQLLLQALALANIKPTVLDPYQGRHTCFKNEAEAYQAFLAEGGHDAYLQKVQQHIGHKTATIIAFSSGATAVWRALAANSYSALQQAWLFYPGHIHQYLHLQPCCSVQVILPTIEPHFLVTEVSEQLQHITKVTVQQAAVEHGFINPESVNYDAKQAKIQINSLLTSLLG